MTSGKILVIPVTLLTLLLNFSFSSQMSNASQPEMSLQIKAQQCLRNIEGYYNRDSYREREQSPEGCEPEIIPLLIQMLKNSDSGVRNQVSMALGFFGAKANAAIPALIEALQDANEDDQHRITSALSQIGSDSIPPLVAIVQNDSATTKLRAGAVWALGGLAGRNASVISVLTSALNDKQPQIQAAAAANLGNLGPMATSAIPKLITALNDPCAEVRRIAAWALGNIKSTNNVVITALSSALKDQNDEVRVASASALLELNRQVSDATPVLVAALKSPNASTRYSAAWELSSHLRNFNNIAPAPIKTLALALTEALSDVDKDVRLEAARGLIDAEYAVPKLVPVLREMMREPDLSMQVADGIRTFGKKPEIAMPLLLETMNSGDSYIREAAIETLGKVGSIAKEALPLLISKLKDSDEDIRLEAAYGIARVAESIERDRDTSAIPSLERALAELQKLAKKDEVDYELEILQQALNHLKQNR